MTAQEAAFQVLKETGTPLSSKVVAERVLKRGLVRSNAADPIASIAQTIEKNIRGGAYNNPKLQFVHTNKGRQIAVPSRQATKTSQRAPTTSVIPPEARDFLEVSVRLVNKLSLVTFANLASTKEEAADLVLARGFDAMKDEIAEGMRRALASRADPDRRGG
jgi:hypothetical protein